VVREVDDAQVLVLALVENLQREDLGPIEEAKGYRRLMDEFGMTQEEVASVVGKSRVVVANTLRLLQLPEEVQKLIEDGMLSAGHGRALLGIHAGEEVIVRAAFEAAKSELPVRELERLATAITDLVPKSSTKQPRSPRKTTLSPELEDIRWRIETALATGVRIRPRRKGGVIEIEYYDDDDLTRLVEALVG
jgi:ParB family chromosome partitioning protein